MAIFMGNSGSLGAVYAGRFVAGLGVGQTVVVGPVYLAEIVRCSPLPAFYEGQGQSNNTPLGPGCYSRSLHLRFHWFRLSRYVVSSQESITHPGLGVVLVSAIRSH